MKKFYTIDKEMKKKTQKHDEKNMKSGVHKHESNGVMEGRARGEVGRSRNMREAFFLAGPSKHQREPFCHQYK